MHEKRKAYLSRAVGLRPVVLDEAGAAELGEALEEALASDGDGHTGVPVPEATAAEGRQLLGAEVENAPTIKPTMMALHESLGIESTPGTWIGAREAARSGLTGAEAERAAARDAEAAQAGAFAEAVASSVALVAGAERTGFITGRALSPPEAFGPFVTDRRVGQLATTMRDRREAQETRATAEEALATLFPRAEAAPVEPVPPVAAAAPRAWGVGMPALLRLHEFGRLVHQAFGRYPALVGSALTTKHPRDIDVRLALPADEYAALVGPEREFGQPGTRWAAFAVAFAAAGREITGLPVDFQLQPPRIAEAHAGLPAVGLGYAVGRFTQAEPERP